MATCAAPDKDELHSVRRSLIRRDIPVCASVGSATAAPVRGRGLKQARDGRDVLAPASAKKVRQRARAGVGLVPR